MNVLVIASPDSQLWRLLRLNRGAENLDWEPVRNRECPRDTRHMGPLGLSSRLEDWLL